MEIGRYPNKLKKYRHIAGLSQKKVARALGFADTSVISRWEHGALLPSMLHVFKLSKLYHAWPHALYEHLWESISLESLGINNNSIIPEEEIHI